MPITQAATGEWSAVASKPSLLKARGPRTGITQPEIVGDSIFPGQSTAGVTLGGDARANERPCVIYLRAASARSFMQSQAEV